MSAIFTSVADDDTGATDLAGMLAGQGLRTVLLIDLPGAEDFARFTEGQDAVVVGTGTRNLPKEDAYRITREAVRTLRELEPRMLQIKYCSTFDSTTEGNIGPGIDAALDETGETFTVAVPALPVNGRTTYLGYHFVKGQLMSESPMRNHPLTPMTDANLVRHLQAQTKRKVGLAGLPDVLAGPKALRARLDALAGEGVAIAVVDCVTDADLDTIAEAVAEMPVTTGGSGPAMRLPEAWRRRGWLAETSAEPVRAEAAAGGKGFLVVAGSCSQATLGQNARFEKDGARVVRPDVRALLGGDSGDAVVIEAAEALTRRESCLLTTSAPPEEVKAIQDEAGGDAAAVGRRLAHAVAGIARRVLDRQVPRALLLAGGETSSSICRELQLGALQVGANIEPGVPLCQALGRYKLPVVLKSGNFGSEGFYSEVAALTA